MKHMNSPPLNSAPGSEIPQIDTAVREKTETAVFAMG